MSARFSLLYPEIIFDLTVSLAGYFMRQFASLVVSLEFLKCLYIFYVPLTMHAPIILLRIKDKFMLFLPAYDETLNHLR